MIGRPHALEALRRDYPWTTPNAPVVVSAPMLKIAMARLTISVSANGGIGFLAGGFDLTQLEQQLAEASDLAKSVGLASHNGVLPFGLGFLNWGASLELALTVLAKHPVAAVWLFAPRQASDLVQWATAIRHVTRGKTKIWVQVGTVAEAVEVAKATKPDVMVVQGSDSGGHGLRYRASLMTLMPEVRDVLSNEGIDNIALIAAGGVIDGRGAAAALALGADGVCLGTRLLASHEAAIAQGYKDEVLRAADGGTNTVATTIYDTVRGFNEWPKSYVGRGLTNQTFLDAEKGMDTKQNVELYKAAMALGDSAWGPDGRMCTYAGTGVGLIREVMSVGDIVKSVQREALQIWQSNPLRPKL
jgi:nitronate monooxygenase